MKFSILQQDFFPTLSAVARSCGVRSQLPVLSHVLLRAGKGKLEISATNLEVGVVKLAKAEVLEEGELTVPAKTLVEVVANLAGEKIDFTATPDQLEISTSGFSSKMNGIPAAEFPAIPLLGKDAALLDPKSLTSSLPQVTFAAASDDGRPILTGILTEIRDGKLELVATDGYRLAHKTVKVDKSSSFKALIPRRTMEEIARLVVEDEVDEIRIAVSDDSNQVVFTFGNTKVSSRLIEGQFPAWEKIIPTEAKARVVVERAEALKAVKLASVFTRSEANIVTLQNTARGRVIFTSAAKEVGSQQKEVEAQTEGEEIQISFNTRFLIDVLSAAASSQLMIELSGSLSAAMIKPVGEEGLEYVIMPVNLS